MTGLPEAKAALERGRNVVVVAPPAVEHAQAVWELVPETPGLRPGSVIICADPTAAVEWADAAPAGRRVHAVTGLSRTERLLQLGAPEIIAGAAKDLSALVARSALKLADVETVVVAWPETLVALGDPQLDALLAEARGARRIVVTWAPSAIQSFLDGHAHRAPMVGTPPVDADGRPAPPIGPARYAVVARDRRRAAARAALDALDVALAVVWQRGAVLPQRCDGVICLDLPSREEFAALSALAQPLLLITASQIPYARSVASPLRPFSLPTEADLARDRAEELRARVAEVLERGDVDAEFALLDPLFERYEPAQVAAALLAMSRQPSANSHQPSAVRQPPAVAEWTRIFVGVGKKDRASAKDLVGALIREAGLAKEEIGKIETRETFTLVDVAAGAVDKAVRGLTGATIRGRRVTVRPDRAR